jgi:hypothetical protein
MTDEMNGSLSQAKLHTISEHICTTKCHQAGAHMLLQKTHKRDIIIEALPLVV